MLYPSQQTSLYAMNTLTDGQRFGRGVSLFDKPENIVSWLKNEYEVITNG